MSNSKKLMILGCAVSAATIISMCTGQSGGERYVPVSSFGETGEIPALGEPDGYLGGEWNLWEFIGDSINRMLSGS